MLLETDDRDERAYHWRLQQLRELREADRMASWAVEYCLAGIADNAAAHAALAWGLLLDAHSLRYREVSR